MYIHVEYAHVYTNHICTHIHVYTLYIYFTLQVINHAGVCTSYTATWDHLLYAGMVQVSHTNARPLGYTGMA